MADKLKFTDASDGNSVTYYDTFAALVAAETIDDDDIVDGLGNTFVITSQWTPDGVRVLGHEAIIQNANISVTAATNGININSRDFLIFKNITIDGNNIANGGIRISDSTGIIIMDSDISRINGAGITDGTANGDITLSNLEISGCSGGISLNADTVTVSDCNIHDNDHSGMQLGAGTGVSNVYDNTISDNGTEGVNDDGIFAGNSTGATYNIYNNIITNQKGQSSIDCSNGVGSTTSTFNIYLNKMLNCDERGIGAGGSSAADNLNLYSNYIQGGQYGIGTRELGIYAISNNTIVSVLNDGNSGILSIVLGAAKELTIKNNIIKGYNVAVNLVTTNLTLTSDYNCFYDQNDSMAQIDYVAKNFTEWQAIAGDAHSITTNPLLTTTGKLKSVSPVKASENLGTAIATVNGTGTADLWENAGADGSIPIGAYFGEGVVVVTTNLFFGNSFAFGLMTGGLCLGGGGLFLSSSSSSGGSSSVITNLQDDTTLTDNTELADA